MANQANPSLQGIAPSWVDVGFSSAIYGGIDFDLDGIDGFKWSRKVEVGEQKGPGGKVRARTTGTASYEASMTLYRKTLREYIKALAAKAPLVGNQRRIALVGFDILIQHTPPFESEIYVTKIKGCRYLGDSDDMKDGNDADKIEVTLNPIEIVNIINGEEILLV